MITEGERLREKSDLEETGRKKCIKKASGGGHGRMELRWRDDDRWR